MRLCNVKIGTRLGVGFGAVLVLLLVVAAVGAGALMQVKRDLDEVSKVTSEKVRIGYELAEKVHVITRVMRTIILLTDAEAQKREMVKITDARIEYETLWKAMQAFEPTAQERRSAVCATPSPAAANRSWP